MAKFTVWTTAKVYRMYEVECENWQELEDKMFLYEDKQEILCNDNLVDIEYDEEEVQDYEAHNPADNPEKVSNHG